MPQATRANAVGALFVFLHLLERQVERVSEFRLGQTKHQATHAHPFSDVGVNWVRSFLRHHCFPQTDSNHQPLRLPCSRLSIPFANNS
jgi:hypothetical protein